MRKLLIIGLLCINCSAMANEAQFNAQFNAAPMDPNYNLSLIGGGVLGMLLASGTVGILSTISMTLEGAGVAEAMEAGAGLTMPVAVLSAILGAFFAQEYVLKAINEFQASGKAGGHAGSSH